MDEPQFSDDTDKVKDKEKGSIDYAPVLEKERDCGSFRRYVVGFDPKEHLQMREQEALRAEEKKEKTRERRWRLIEMALFIAAGAITAVVAAMIERGDLFGQGATGQPVTGTPTTERVVDPTPDTAAAQDQR